MRRILLGVLALIVITAGCFMNNDSSSRKHTSTAHVTVDTKECLDCHSKKQPSIVDSWQKGRHAEAGVGCYECHQANYGENDAFMHFERYISVIVSPKDCSRCHETEAEEFLASHHAKAGEVLGSLDNFLGEVVEGFAANVSGCQQCHGSKVIVLADGMLSHETWPNFGIGRINPDSTSGSCSACHARHEFSIAQARTPETCGKCHLGPDHPQFEIYRESKHGIVYRANEDEMNMDSRTWVVGRDYTAAPTCATCHVSATINQGRTHDIGLRLSWNIRAAVSFKMEDAERKRRAMRDVCMTCHNPLYVDGFYSQFDAGIELFNRKFAEPAKQIMTSLREAGKIDPTPFNDHIEWIYFYLWHHEGRRARNGIAMMGPDYVQWHGFYDIAERFYMEMVPEAEHLMKGVTKEVMAMPEHRWFSGGMSSEDREKMTDFYREKYGTTP